MGRQHPKEQTMKKMILFSLFFSLFVSPGYPEDEREGSIAVASTGPTTESSVDHRAGRSAYFLIFDNEGKLVEAVDNPHKNADRSAGSLAAELLDGKGVTLLVAGSVGGRMAEELEKREIAYIEITGTVADALERALDGRP
jgi:predicted Fe-Mo cluster-binding NifX family protein